jgi:hypothetical protein
MRKIISFSLTAAVAIATLTISPASHAGSASSGPIEGCTFNADGSAQCWGNLEGYLRGPGNDSVTFTVQDSGYGYFWGRFGTRYVSCAKPVATPIWYSAAITPPNVFFDVAWNAAGQCTYLSLQNSSFN